MELYSVTDTDPPSKRPRGKGLGPSDPYPQLVLGAGQGRALAKGQCCLAYSLRPRVVAAVDWPLPMLGAWLCAPTPFLTELYKRLFKKKKKMQAKVL